MHTFDTPQPISVVVEIGMGAIHITASDRTDTVVEVRASDEAKKSDVAAAEQTTVDFADGTLLIMGPKGWRQWTPWAGHGSIDVRVDLPRGSGVRGSAGAATLQCDGRVGECRYKVGAGNVRIDACGPVAIAAGASDIDIGRADGAVELKLSGSVRIGSVDGTATIKNSNGDTSIHEITGDLRISAANGNIAVDRARASVVLKCANGDVRLDEAERGPIVAETARGNVEVGIRDGVAAWLDLGTAYGRVRNDLDAAGAPAPGEDAIEVRARTANGDITIRRAPTDEKMTGSTTEVQTRAVDPISVLRKAVDQTGRIVAGVKSDQLSAPTPCAEWDTRALLNHTIGVVEMFDDAAQTKPFNGSIFAHDNVGDDPGASYETRAAVLRATLAQPDVLDRTWTMPFGEIPGAVGVGFATLELFQHGWDVARASGQQPDFDADVTETAHATAQLMPAEQVRVAGVFGAEGNCPPDASAEDRLAAFLGRPL